MTEPVNSAAADVSIRMQILTQAEIDKLRRAGVGAIATFSGIVRITLKRLG